MGHLYFIAVIAHAQVRVDGLALSDLSDSIITIPCDMKQMTQQITTRGNATVALEKVGANARRMVDLSILADCWREKVGFVWPAALPMFHDAWSSWPAFNAAITNVRAKYAEAHEERTLDAATQVERAGRCCCRSDSGMHACCPVATTVVVLVSSA